jgi:hypothetical protein
MQTDMLRMFRGDAAQHFPIGQATWGFSESNRYSVPILCLAVKAQRMPSVFLEDDEWPHEPRWCLDVWARGMGEDLIRSGSRFSIPSLCDDFTGVIFTMFHYDEHEGTEDNIIKIIQRESDVLALSIEGYIRHPTASMRPTRIMVDARFIRRTLHEEIHAKWSASQIRSRSRRGIFGAGEAHATSIPFTGLRGAGNEACGKKDCRPEGCVAFGLGRCCSSVADPLRICSLLAPSPRPKATQRT